MRKFKFKIRGNEYEVELKNMENNIAEIEVNGTTYEVEVQQEKQRQKTPTIVRKEQKPSPSESTIKKEASSGGEVKAPLPGTIFNILVKEGDSVQKGDTLLVMEAMKMENNVKASKEGVIKSIKVSEGDSVLQDDILVELE